MAIVNYVKESIAFMEYACDNGLSGNERLLWYALFHIMNMRAQGTNWPDGFISISNKRLLSFLPYSEDSLTDARNRLVQHGVIKYVKGKKNEKSPAYALTYFSAASDFFPQIAGKTYGNIGGNMGGNDYGNMGGNTGGNVGGKEYDFLRKLNVGETEHNGNVNNENDRLTTTTTGIFARAREEKPELSYRQLNYVEWFKEFCTDAESVDVFKGLVSSGEYTYAQLSAVLTLVQGKTERGKLSSPIEYLRAVLIDWNKHEVREKGDIEQYMTIDLDPSYCGGYHAAIDYDINSDD